MSQSRVCPTCGVDAQRAMVMVGLLRFYHPEYACPLCGLRFRGSQLAAEHMAKHEPDLVGYLKHLMEVETS